MRLTLGIGLGAILLGALPAVAATGPAGSCVPSSNLVSGERAAQFLDNPEGLLNQYKDGEGRLASEIRDLVSIRPETIEGIKSLAKAGSVDQSRAIGAGLGTAASICVVTQPAIAQQIQEAVLKTENPALIQSFVSITGDIPTEAINGADANGDTTSGGGRGTTTTERPGPVTSSSDASSPERVALTAPTTLFSAASVAGTGLSGSVSPAN